VAVAAVNRRATVTNRRVARVNLVVARLAANRLYASRAIQHDDIIVAAAKHIADVAVHKDGVVAGAA
jgi:hypothetical protein